ncbi:MAG: hypothetical protein ABIQ88_09325 [Chitinophagaceae bacterium]
MKNSSALLLILLFSTCSIAQGVFSNQTNYTLEKVVQDYPSQFKNIRGELISSGAGAEAYKSTIAIPGALTTTITQSAANQKQVLSWESVLYKGSDFKAASSRFEQLFNQIKNTIIKPRGERAVIVNGMYASPSAEMAVSTIQFDMLPPTVLLQKMNIDLTMQNSGSQWTISLRVYDKEPKEGQIVRGK